MIDGSFASNAVPPAAESTPAAPVDTGGVVGHSSAASPLGAAIPAAPPAVAAPSAQRLGATKICQLSAGMTDARGHVLPMRSRMHFSRTHTGLAHTYTLLGTARDGSQTRVELAFGTVETASAPVGEDHRTLDAFRRSLQEAGSAWRMNVQERREFRIACKALVGHGDAAEWVYRMVEHALLCMRESQVEVSQAQPELSALTSEELVAITCWPHNGIWKLLRDTAWQQDLAALPYARAIVSALNALPSPYTYRCEA